ncbi:blue copper protein-like [Trifolium pratense]|uniref:blue copper protein-like n=1 Tax=Trifolium pratense TaxID=57577 RepID=UPI001E6929F6|nr:blue copper protein-like [Trifolium pratense]
MAKNLNALVFVLLTVATLLHGSLAQTKHVVGDTTGWTIPTGGAQFYTNWASKKTFTVGDTLVFNFASGAHDVSKVTKTAYDGCDGTTTLSKVTNSPASVTLNETGQQYFLCSIPGHCSAGQKISINVVKASTSPVAAPKPSATPPKASVTPVAAPTPATAVSPAPAPTADSPAPATGAVTYTVGDTIGWTIPTNGAAAYTTWASRKSFKVGDVLVFNFQSSAHNVEEVTKEKYDSCNSASPIATFSTPPVRVTLNKTGTHYYICGFPGHCNGGQKLTIKVGGGSSSNSPATSPSPASSSPSPSAGATPPSADSPSGSNVPSSQSPGGSATSPPPENSGAASLGVAGLFVTFLSVAAAFFC